MILHNKGPFKALYNMHVESNQYGLQFKDLKLP